MGDVTQIEWTDKTQSPWVGCQKVSAACDNCYAESWGKRSGLVGWGPHAERRRTSDANWAQLQKWNRQGSFSVFPSLCDPFDNHRSIQPEWRADYWRKVQECQNLRFLLLTKRPQNIHKLCPFNYGTFPENAWFGATIESQDVADKSLQHLAQVPSQGRFISCEPLLGPIDLTRVKDGEHGYFNALTGELSGGGFVHAIDWVIAGGESGAGSRPSNPEWFRSLRDQCRAYGVSFLFKQWGDWCPIGPQDIARGTRHRPDFGVVRLGKKTAGRLLDGITIAEFPWVQ
jgi:protein gp37